VEAVRGLRGGDVRRLRNGPGHAGHKATPTRFVRALFDATNGYEGDPKLLTAFPTECRGGPDCSIAQTIEGPIEFFSLCEHHALPFHGHAYIGYIAHEEIIGISKLTRLVRVFARRFTVQERVGVEIADELVRVLQPHGVAVHLNAMHLCTQMRGVREAHSRTLTSSGGQLRNRSQLRRSFYRPQLHEATTEPEHVLEPFDVLFETDLPRTRCPKRCAVYTAGWDSQSTLCTRTSFPRSTAR